MPRLIQGQGCILNDLRGGRFDRITVLTLRFLTDRSGARCMPRLSRPGVDPESPQRGSI